MPRATQVNAATVAPMPIPAFTPVDRPLVLGISLAVVDGVAVGNDDDDDDDDDGARVESEAIFE
jgi:ribonuclease PH